MSVAEPTGPTLPAPGTVTMFTTTWCGYCRRLKSQMEREGIGFTEVDIEREPGTAEFVMSVNGGNQTVPDAALPRRLGSHQPLDRPGPRPPRLSPSLAASAQGDLRRVERAAEPVLDDPP